MEINGKEINGKTADDTTIRQIIGEILSPVGSTTVLTTNILRNWSREKIRAFAKHLLGDNNR
jgi:hypothetical protein